MTIEELNNEAFELVKLVTQKLNNTSQECGELSGSIKERGIIDWPGKVVGGAMVQRITDHIGNTVEIYLSDESGTRGFNKNNYLRFKALIKHLHLIEHINNIASISFIESESFNWIINVHKNLKAESSLYDYLLTSIDSKVKLFTFYFPVLNLEIESPFTIGNVEFTYFTKEYLDDIYNSLREKNKTFTEQNFSQIYRKDFQGRVLTKVTVRAERNKAEEIAKQNAEISVDVLKLFSDTASNPEKKTMFDLNYRLNYPVKSNFLTQKPNESDSLAISIQFNNSSFSFNTQQYLSASRNGLKIFSKFLTQRKNNELRNIIIHHFIYSVPQYQIGTYI